MAPIYNISSVLVKPSEKMGVPVEEIGSKYG